MTCLLRAAALTAALFTFSPGPAAAQDATLTARGGGLSVSGRLVAYDGVVYRIDTAWGRLTVDAESVDCAGPGCPDLLRFAPEWRVAVEPWLTDRLLLPLAQGFARAEGLSLTTPDPETLEFAAEGRTMLRMRLLPLSGAPEPPLAAGGADAALAVPAPGRRAGALVARLPLTLASAPEAPTGTLTVEAVLAARRDAAPTWAATGAATTPLVWHGLPAGSTLDRAGTAALGAARGPVVTAPDPLRLAETLRRDPWGLALLPTPLPAGLVERDLATSCGLAADLSDFAAATGEHPLTLPVHWMPGSARPPALVRDFAEWATGPSARRILAEAGLPTPALERLRPWADQGRRLANAVLAASNPAAQANLREGVRALSEAEQAAITFRLDPRTLSLDAASRAALDQLAAHLAAGAIAGKELLLVGFAHARQSDGEALAEAEAVRSALLAAAPDLPPEARVTALSLGRSFPVACDDTAEGRRLNRRVEVWLRPLR